MPIKEEFFNELQKKYSPLVKNLIESNYEYIGISEPIKWGFVWDDTISITGATNRETNLISVNLAYVDEAYSTNKPYDVEHFLIHEMRHIFQHIQIRDYKDGKETVVDPKLIELWVKETENYTTAVNKEGEVNVGYFKQDTEMDAYAFSFAVMHHKYKGKYDRLLYTPTAYIDELKEDYNSIVNGFLMSFNEVE